MLKIIAVLLMIGNKYRILNFLLMLKKLLSGAEILLKIKIKQEHRIKKSNKFKI